MFHLSLLPSAGKRGRFTGGDVSWFFDRDELARLWRASEYIGGHYHRGYHRHDQRLGREDHDNHDHNDYTHTRGPIPYAPLWSRRL